MLQLLVEPGRPRLVLLGDPGSGKSALARYLVLADGSQAGPLVTLDGWLPVLVELRTYAEARWRDRTFLAAFSAFECDTFGNTESRYLVEMSPRLYRRPGGKLTSYGLKMHPWSENARAAYPWVATPVVSASAGYAAQRVLMFPSADDHPH